MSAGSFLRGLLCSTNRHYTHGQFFMQIPNWYKIKGYYHVSAKASINPYSISRNIKRIVNKEYVSQYAFYPLLHVNIKQRRFKKDPDTGIRSYTQSSDGKIVSNAKVRPIHYANHQDALIFSYYSHILQSKYESILDKDEKFSSCITAYRKIEDPETRKGKSNIHFAKEVFDEIRTRALKDGECIVLAFDIKSYFSSLDHEILREKWEWLIDARLPNDHQNVFNAATRFSFIYKNDLRNNQYKKRTRNLDEKGIAKIRNKHGFEAFFSSPAEFRNAVHDGRLRIYKSPFKNRQSGKPIGIPQGLAISAMLGNLYLIDFDRTIFNSLVNDKGCFFRRYSDDIIIITNRENATHVKDYVNSQINKHNIDLSHDKTEEFIFLNGTDNSVCSFEFRNSLPGKKKSLTYLGFEFDGMRPLIKSTNISKFYRKMIYAVKSRCKRALKESERTGKNPVLFKRQLFKIYRDHDLDKTIVKFRNFKRIEKNDVGEYRVIVSRMRSKPHGNYLTYVRRASEIMEEPAINNQLRNEKKIFNQAIQKHLMKE